jgi:hypothetical protein
VELVVSSVVSIVTGVALWALLPRGVVLTRAVRTQSMIGQALYDTWEIKNDSPVPVTILSVTVAGPHTVDLKTSTVRDLELPVFEGDAHATDHGVSLTFDDDSSEISRVDASKPWRGLEIPPGDTLQAHVLNNRTLTIKYRRSGRTGLLERRSIVVHGYA